MKMIFLIVGEGEDGLIIHSAFTNKKKRDMVLAQLEKDEQPYDYWSGWGPEQVILNAKNF